MISKLKDLAKLTTGFNFRTAIKEVQNPSFYVIQSKDLSDRLYVSQGLIGIENANYRTQAIAQINDVLLSARGSFRASVLKSSKKIIVASSVYIIRLTNHKILPEYLTIYLNSDLGQTQLYQKTTGVVINTIPMESLKEMEIKYPSISTQSKIIDIYKNNLLLSEKLLTKANIIKSVANNLINSL